MAYPLNDLANLYREQGKYAQAEPLYQRALHIWEQALGPDHPQVAYRLNGLASLYQNRVSMPRQSLCTSEPCASGSRRWVPTILTHERVARNYASLLRKMGREAEAQQLEAHFPSSS